MMRVHFQIKGARTKNKQIKREPLKKFGQALD